MTSPIDDIIIDLEPKPLLSDEELKRKKNKRQVLSIAMLFVCIAMYYEYKRLLNSNSEINFIEVAMELSLTLFLCGFIFGSLLSAIPFKGLPYYKKVKLFSLTAILFIELLIVVILSIGIYNLNAISNQ